MSLFSVVPVLPSLSSAYVKRALIPLSSDFCSNKFHPSTIESETNTIGSHKLKKTAKKLRGGEKKNIGLFTEVKEGTKITQDR